MGQPNNGGGRNNNGGGRNNNGGGNNLPGPNNVGRDNTNWQNIWDLIKNFGNENCPRCSNTEECYVECNTEGMQEFTGVSNWANCKDQCLSLGGNFAYEFDTWKSDRGCAMYSQKDMGRCVCVPGQQFACRNIQGGSENCPNCGGAPECLAECDSDKRREFEDIADWGDCTDRCKQIGGLYTYKWGTWNSDRACAIYAKYDNVGTQGKCVCVQGDSYACDNYAFGDVNAPPALPQPDSDGPNEIPAMPVFPAPQNGLSFDMIEGYGIGVISTLFILLIGVVIAYVSRRWNSITNTKQYAKVSYIDTEDEQIAVQ